MTQPKTRPVRKLSHASIAKAPQTIARSYLAAVSMLTSFIDRFRKQKGRIRTNADALPEG